jgi:uncharacterized sodium:solute symporter family permease YidK
MKQYLKVGGWHIPLEDMKEENWSPRTRKIISWLAIAAFAIVTYALIYFAGTVKP